MINIYTVKWGTKYSSDHVNKILAQCKQHITSEFKFYCITETPADLDPEVIVIPLPEDNYYEKWWNKLYLFERDVVAQQGEKLFLDLDIKNSNPYGEDGIIIFRPKSLTGIETNNGWIKIDNEEQYNELFNDLYEWYNIKKKESWIGDLEYYSKATHYRIIQPNKPPIY